MAGVYNYEATIDVQWLFGYGLSYTTFKYSNLCVNRKEFTHKDTLSFSVDVTNTVLVKVWKAYFSSPAILWLLLLRI